LAGAAAVPGADLLGVGVGVGLLLTGECVLFAPTEGVAWTGLGPELAARLAP
jgi:hypothetical protein